MPNRRRIANPLTADFVQYTANETEFFMAIDQYKRDNRRPHPTWREVLAIVHALGYRQVAEKTEMPYFKNRVSQA